MMSIDLDSAIYSIVSLTLVYLFDRFTSDLLFCPYVPPERRVSNMSSIEIHWKLPKSLSDSSYHRHIVYSRDRPTIFRTPASKNHLNDFERNSLPLPFPVHRVVHIERHHSGKVYLAKFVSDNNTSGERTNQPVVVKMASGAEEMAVLARECRLYMKELGSLQGSIVPTCYGYYETRHASCMVLEYCPPADLRDMKDTSEVNRQIMLAVCQLHKAGINHTNLSDRSHILVTADTGYFNCHQQTKFGVRFVGFASALRHACSLQDSYPTLQRQKPQGGQCSELQMMEQMYGIFSGDAIQPPAGRFASLWLR